MKKLLPVMLVLIFVAAVTFTGCGAGVQEEAPSGTLQFRANGEDFIQQGFVAKDGWALTFDHVYITLADAIAYQAEPPFEPEKGDEIQAETKVSLPSTHLVDLAAGDAEAPPILVGEVAEVPVGHYNAISWHMVKAAAGPTEGYSLVIMGQAEKEGEIVDFTIKVEQEYACTAGEFVGEERKGIVQEGGVADLEMTFHFDHLFGDAGAPVDDAINVGALGFEPFAAVAENGTVDVDLAVLETKFSPADYQQLKKKLSSLPHVGEGHCYVKVL